jgi:hypothetical protein
MEESEGEDEEEGNVAGGGDGGVAHEPGTAVPPRWAVCYHPHGCNGRRRFLKDEEYFSRTQLKKVKSDKRRCKRCLRIGKSIKELEQLEANLKRGAEQHGSVMYKERRHRDTENRARALTAMTMFEVLEGKELLQWAAENDNSMHAFSRHIHAVTTQRGRVSFEAVLRQLDGVRRGGGEEGQGTGSAGPRILNLGCGWATDEFQAAVVAAGIEKATVTHVDIFDYSAGQCDIIVADMCEMEESIAAGAYDLVVVIDAVFAVARADGLVQQIRGVLARGGVAGVYQVDGYLGDVVLAVARAAERTPGLGVVLYEEGQRGAAEANRAAEADAVAFATDKRDGGAEGGAVDVEESFCPDAIGHSAGLMLQPDTSRGGGKEEPWGVNFVVIKAGNDSMGVCLLPRRALRVPPRGAHVQFFLTYSLGLASSPGGPVDSFYHGQAVQRQDQSDPVETARVRFGEHVDLLLDVEHTHNSPRLQELFDSIGRPDLRKMFSSDRLPSPTVDPTSNPWGHVYGNATFAFTIYPREDCETPGACCERATRMEQALLDRDPNRLNASAVAGSIPFAAASAGGALHRGFSEERGVL